MMIMMISMMMNMMIMMITILAGDFNAGLDERVYQLVSWWSYDNDGYDD